MPRNMKKLKDMLPKKNYDPIEKPVVETIYSEKPMQKKGSKMEYESKLNYESDANALKQNEMKTKNEQRERRAARFRDRS